jgi:hypothetical protein
MSDERDDGFEQFQNMGKGIRDILQSVEDALIDAGYDDFVVARKRGTFRWRAVERAREDAAKDQEPQAGA